jgi:hypothetical protein
MKQANKFRYLYVIQFKYEDLPWEDEDETEDYQNARFRTE